MGISEDRITALRDLENDAKNKRGWAVERLTAIDVFLFNDEFSNADFQRIIKRTKGLTPAETTGLNVYNMMSQLMLLCRPKGKRVGPCCAVELIDFETQTRESASALPGGAFHAGIIRASIASGKKKFRGLDLLSLEQRELYHRARSYLSDNLEGTKRKRLKLTLKGLATCLLKEDAVGYSEQSVRRGIKAINSHKFLETDTRRDRIFTSVNSFAERETVRPIRLDLEALRSVLGTSEIVAAQLAGGLRQMSELEVLKETMAHVAEGLGIIASQTMTQNLEELSAGILGLHHQTMNEATVRAVMMFSEMRQNQFIEAAALNALGLLGRSQLVQDEPL